MTTLAVLVGRGELRQHCRWPVHLRTAASGRDGTSLGKADVRDDPTPAMETFEFDQNPLLHAVLLTGVWVEDASRLTRWPSSD